MFPQDANQEHAAASQAVAGAPEQGVRSVAPQVFPVAPRAFAGRGVFVSGRRVHDGRRLPLSRALRATTPDPAVVAGPVIPS